MSKRSDFIVGNGSEDDLRHADIGYVKVLPVLGFRGYLFENVRVYYLYLRATKNKSAGSLPKQQSPNNDIVKS